jgi:hypothetical protein
MSRTNRDPLQRGTHAKGLIRLDGTGSGEAFRRRVPVEFSHTLQDHPLLTLEAIAKLADDLPRDSVIYDTANQALLVPQGGPPRGELERPGDVIRNLDQNESWLTLLNIEQLPAYEELVNDALDDLQPELTGRDRKMLRRVGFVFVSSPRSTTPAHFDIEHSFIMQMHGQKTLTFGEYETPADRQHEIDRYWDGSHGRIEKLPPERASYHLTPGVGVYIPPIAPHWVRNGDEISISVTLTFFTPDTDRDSLVNPFNARLRRMGRSPRPAGRSAVVDEAKATVMRVRRRLKRRKGPEAGGRGRG